MSDIINIISIVLVLLLWFFIIKRLVQSKYAPVKTVKAEVVDKYKVKPLSKHPATGMQEGCVVVFKTKGKKLSFYVSEFSYMNYKIKDKGTLSYKGTQIINFK